MSGQQLPVTVGVDGGAPSAMAVRWAIAEARTRRAPLRLMYVRERQMTGTVLGAALEETIGKAGDLAVAGAIADGDRVRVLVEESARCQLLVLGARRLGRLSGAVLGSVNSAVTARSACPVVVVRGQSGYPEGHVVVGVSRVDGGEETDDVLEFAFDHAARHRLPVRAVLCLRPGPGSDRRATGSVAFLASDRVSSGDLSEALAGWQDKYPDVPVECRVREAHAVDGLLEEALQASLVVVGAHGRNALAGTFLGSVSQGVLHHATSPVAVVHPAGGSGSTVGWSVGRLGRAR
ncbi:MAG TPA: universal stress protein [Actinopolymorphaceae bacterium]|nr:universal stress protein [Actinopolymorphaceae bacterium]